MENRFEKRLTALLKGYRLDQYREASVRASFVEFWIVDEELPANTDISFQTLKKISKLLGTTEITVTGGDLSGACCELNRDKVQGTTGVLVTCYGVKFNARKKARQSGRDTTASGL